MDPQILAFSQLLAEYDCFLNSQQLKQFECFRCLLSDWSLRTNLVSKRDRGRLVMRHFLESVAVLFVVEIPPKAVILDLGTGAGFPGIPMKILRPDLNMVLIDSKRMKSLFLRKVVAELSLGETEVECVRVEDISDEYAQNFDVIVSRAVAPLVDLWRWSRPLLIQKGRLLAMKGGDLQSEFAALKDAFPDVRVAVRGFHKKLVADSEKKIVLIEY